MAGLCNDAGKGVEPQERGARQSRTPGVSRLAALAPAAALLLAGSACLADVEERNARCAEESSSTDRIACLEESLRELAGAEHVSSPSQNRGK